MIRPFVLVTAAAAASLAACAPLEQAPLVYASRVQMGVGVATGTGETPGFDVTIGYKQLDTAFVPVAVAKPCTPKDDCTGVDHDITVVQGSNKLSGQSLLDDAAARQAQGAIAAAQQDIDAAAGRIAQADKTLAGVAALPAKQTELDQLTALQQAADAPAAAAVAPAPTLDAAQVKRKAELTADIAALSPQRQAELRDARAADQVLLTKRSTDKADAQAMLDKILARRDRRDDDDKSDAYSVYGSFNGDAEGKKEGAGLKLGKVFSTGIAAQNVSQGIGNSARVDAVAKCLEQAAALTKGVTDVALLQAALHACRADERSN